MKKARAGFTIVELVVVIAVIGILAGITIMSYSRSQLNARDTAIKNAAAQTADALQLWATRNNTTPDKTGSSGAGGTDTGWVQPSATGTRNNIETALVSAGYLPNGFSSNLRSQTVSNANILMFHRCTNGRYVVFAALNDTSGADAAKDKASAAGCTMTFFNTTYNMNYVVIF